MSSKKLKASDKTICDQLDTEFINDKNPHKYATLWASAFYRQINQIMRMVDTDQIIKYFPCTTYFISKYIRYIYKNGITKEQLSGIPYLYRGLTDNFEILPHFIENGLMSTSYDKKIAKTFAQNEGSIIIFPTKLLPDDVPFLVINDTISEYLNESEILFLPGQIWTNRINNNII